MKFKCSSELPRFITENTKQVQARIEQNTAEIQARLGLFEETMKHGDPQKIAHQLFELGKLANPKKSEVMLEM